LEATSCCPPLPPRSRRPTAATTPTGMPSAPAPRRSGPSRSPGWTAGSRSSVSTSA